MIQFWVRYVLLKEQQGIDRTVTLAQIEAKYGEEFRQQVEEKLPYPAE